MILNTKKIGLTIGFMLLFFSSGWFSHIWTEKQEFLSLYRFILWESSDIKSSAATLISLHEQNYDNKIAELVRYRFLVQLNKFSVLIQEADQEEQKEGIHFIAREIVEIVKTGLEKESFGFDPITSDTTTRVIEGIEQDITP